MTEFTIPETMRAHVFYENGEPTKVLQFKEDYPVPKLAPNELLVQVHATSINPIDWKIIKGDIVAKFFKLPLVACFDFSGVVVAVGDKVTNFKVGEKVYGDNSPKGYGLAEYAPVPENNAHPMPKNLSFTEAAAVPLAGLTAWQAIVDTGNVKEGQRVLINGGSGGVGSYAIQIAKYFGAEVTTTCSERNIALVKSLGTDRVIDYTKENVTEIFKQNDFDIVFDTVGCPFYSSASTLMKPTGHYITIVGDGPHFLDGIFPLITAVTRLVSRKLYARIVGGVTYDLLVTNADGKGLQGLTKAIEEGKIKPLIDSTYRVEKALEAIDHSITSRASGKLVVIVKDD
ncbi:alcohol dehydrogenase zinc-binding domain-containing protein [Endogone sp. FLAS-F59071]|nr:alcohol dehydrogenase zinc-binding domain-containing protein [Endogone sp. FLAS-F59071]|eukprot:RUS15973.1 alcohol dehydrogenase zinc-binding domain-containing protein [Endogone sp. FLAS-F59071]